MRIDINQKKISIGDKYLIFTEGQQTHSASTELFRFLSVINLFDKESSRALLTINKQWSWLGPKYDIQLRDNNNLKFTTKSLWKLHYQCQDGQDLFDIYGNRGRKYSVYKNDTQIAWWDKEAVTWFEGDNYKIFADKYCNCELIIAFCLIIDNYASNNKEGSTVSIDLGNIGGQTRKFNPDWQPKTEK
jgi:uncharacterized protein YxjI